MRKPPVIDEGLSTTKPIRKDAIGLSYHVMNGVRLKVLDSLAEDGRVILEAPDPGIAWSTENAANLA